jgi:hypothetical protein
MNKKPGCSNLNKLKNSFPESPSPEKGQHGKGKKKLSRNPIKWFRDSLNKP